MLNVQKEDFNMNHKILKMLSLVLWMSGIPLFHSQASQFEISLFRGHVAEFERASAQYQSAPSGSFQEQMADRERRQQAFQAQNAIRLESAFQGFTALETEQFFHEFHSAYQAASSGSLREQIYLVASKAAAAGLKSNSVAELQMAYDYEEAFQKTLDAHQKYISATSGSLIEGIYDFIRREGFRISKERFKDHLNQVVYDFRTAESLFLQMTQQYMNATSGSMIENYYDSGRRAAHARTIELVRIQVTLMTPGELLSLEAEYQGRYQAASSGSLAENLYLTIRNEARARLSTNPYPPVPAPVPQPQPQPRGCQVMPGRDAYGQTLYRVIDRAGRILATTRSEQEAYQISITDSRCY